jgi:hypothetical protein
MTTQEMEAKRLEAVAEQKLQKSKAILPNIFFVISFISLAISGLSGNIPMIIVSVIALVGFYVWKNHYESKAKAAYDGFNQMFKENLVVASLSEIMKVYSFKPDEHFSREVLYAAHIFNFDTVSGNDLLEAEYKGYRFEQCDLHLQEEYTTTDDEGNETTHYRTTFKGRLMVIDYDVFTNEPVYVTDRGGRIKDKALMKEMSDKRVVHTESAEFNSRFKVTSDSAVDALRVLTPHMITGILEANDRLKVAVNFSFKNDKIYFAWGNGSDLMEADKSGRKTVEEQKLQIQSDIKAITDFLDSFPLRTLKQ